MLFTVVIPNFNSGKVLDRAIRSILAQEYGPIQLILADGGSTDESLDVIRRYSPRFDLVLAGPDGGQVDGLNRAFTHARGEVCCWLCADDEFLPGALRAVANAFQRDPSLEVIAGACQLRYPDRSQCVVVPPADPWAQIAVKNVLNQPSVFWRASLHQRIGQLDPSFNLAFDWDFWCRMREAQAKILVTRRALSRYHFSHQNKTSIAGRAHVDEGFRIIRRYGPGHGRIAYVYRWVYKYFDLKGCMDHPPTSSFARVLAFRATCLAVRLTLGPAAMTEYNWHFASRQERNLEWWNG